MPIKFDNANFCTSCASSSCEPPVFANCLKTANTVTLYIDNYINTQFSTDDGNTWICVNTNSNTQPATIVIEGPELSLLPRPFILMRNQCSENNCSRVVKFQVLCGEE